MNTVTDRFYTVLRSALEKRGEAARMSRDCGFSPQYLSAVVAGVRKPGLENTLLILEWITVHQRAAIFRKDEASTPKIVEQIREAQ
jgi:hypothetical protein